MSDPEKHHRGRGGGRGGTGGRGCRKERGRGEDREGGEAMRIDGRERKEEMRKENRGGEPRRRWRHER